LYRYTKSSSGGAGAGGLIGAALGAAAIGAAVGLYKLSSVDP
jgi:hypothetical protein